MAQRLWSMRPSGHDYVVSDDGLLLKFGSVTTKFVEAYVPRWPLVPDINGLHAQAAGGYIRYDERTDALSLSSAQALQSSAPPVGQPRMSDSPCTAGPRRLKDCGVTRRTSMPWHRVSQLLRRARQQQSMRFR